MAEDGTAERVGDKADYMGLTVIGRKTFRQPRRVWCPGHRRQSEGPRRPARDYGGRRRQEHRRRTDLRHRLRSGTRLPVMAHGRRPVRRRPQRRPAPEHRWRRLLTADRHRSGRAAPSADRRRRTARPGRHAERGVRVPRRRQDVHRAPARVLRRRTLSAPPTVSGGVPLRRDSRQPGWRRPPAPRPGSGSGWVRAGGRPGRSSPVPVQQRAGEAATTPPNFAALGRLLCGRTP